MLAALVFGGVLGIAILVVLVTAVCLWHKRKTAATKRHLDKRRNKNNPAYCQEDQRFEMSPLQNNSLRPEQKYTFRTFLGTNPRV